MKIRILMTVLMSLASANAMAAPSAEEMKKNFEICNAQDSAWYHAWGRWVVAFDIYTAREKCGMSYSPQLTGCRFQGDWIRAGYYCQEHNN